MQNNNAIITISTIALLPADDDKSQLRLPSHLNVTEKLDRCERNPTTIETPTLKRSTF
jgi:hypothetical protein